MPTNLDFYSEAVDDLSFSGKMLHFNKVLCLCNISPKLFSNFLCEAQSVNPICIYKKNELNVIYQIDCSVVMERYFRKINSIFYVYSKYTRNFQSTTSVLQSNLFHTKESISGSKFILISIIS